MDRQRTTLLQGTIVLRPVLGRVSRWCPVAHHRQLSRWFHNMTPLNRFVQQSWGTPDAQALL
jgi:hypothetical protein